MTLVNDYWSVQIQQAKLKYKQITQAGNLSVRRRERCHHICLISTHAFCRIEADEPAQEADSLLALRLASLLTPSFSPDSFGPWSLQLREAASCAHITPALHLCGRYGPALAHRHVRMIDTSIMCQDEHTPAPVACS